MKMIYILSYILLLFVTFDSKCVNADSLKPESIEGTIGVAKIISHPALDAIESGLYDELIAQGFNKLKFDYQSANGEISTAASIAGKFKNDKVLLAVGIATPMALALANNLDNIPIVFSAVTDPVDAGLRANIIKEDINITGVSDKNPLKEQIELIIELTGARRIGFIYNAGESNSLVIVSELEKICRELGVKLVSTTATNTAEVIQAAREIVRKKVDAIYISTDNVVASAINSVTATALKNGIPVIGADPVTSLYTGALAAYGVDYYKSGRQTGMIIARILMGEKPGEIPVKFMTESSDLELYIDYDIAKILKVKIPDNLKNNL